MIARGLEWIGTGLIHLKNETSLMKLYLLTQPKVAFDRYLGLVQVMKCWRDTAKFGKAAPVLVEVYNDIGTYDRVTTNLMKVFVNYDLKL